MKKFSAIIITLAMAACLTACDNSENLSDSGGSYAPDSSDNSTSDSAPTAPDGGQNSDEAPVPEKPKPDGEPTFLICPDGEPIYTSEISRFLKYDRDSYTYVPDEEGGLENFNAAECDGFVYGYFPRQAYNYAENPEMFRSETYSGFEYHYYKDIIEYTDSTEYFRIREGDRFDSLTVSRAYSVFSADKLRNFSGEEDMSVPGAYLTGGCLEFEGEIELTGYITVEEDGNYTNDGEMIFYPDNESSTKLPFIEYYWDSNKRVLYHGYNSSYYGYYGDKQYKLGNIIDYDIDLYGLKPGDSFVRVRVTLGDVRLDAQEYVVDGLYAVIKSVERL